MDDQWKLAEDVVVEDIDGHRCISCRGCCKQLEKGAATPIFHTISAQLLAGAMCPLLEPQLPPSVSHNPNLVDH